MADLKTNYVDDVLDTTKNQLRKYQQIQNDDGTVSFVDVTEYTQVGTSFGAKDINDTNAAINDVNGNLNEIEGKIDNSIKKVNIHHSGTTEVEYTLPQNIGLNDVIICNSSFGGVSGTTFVLGGYALYYSAFSTHVAYTIPAPNSTSSNATSTVTLIAQNKIKVKCNNANAFCSVTVIMGGNSAN